MHNFCDFIGWVIVAGLSYIAVIFLWQYNKQMRNERAKHGEVIRELLNECSVDFHKKFANYIEQNRSDIQNWRNADKDKIDKLSERVTKIEKTVWPPQRKT